VQALVLVGGRGTRLLPLTETVPKPVLPLVDRPFLVYFLEWLATHGVDRVVLACGFRPEVMKKVLGEGGDGLPAITWVVEDEPLGTAGAMRHALEYLDEEFLALNGDLLSDFDLGGLVRHHRESGALATLGLKEVDDPGPYGLVELAGDGTVAGFSEKPGDASKLPPGPWLVNAGTYVLTRPVIEALPAGENISIERDVFPGLVGHGMAGLRLDGYWMDIGTPERYLQATWDVLEGRFETSVPAPDDSVCLSGEVVLSPESKVGPRVVLGDGCAVAEGASVRRSVLFPGVSIGPGAHVENSILGVGEVVGEAERVVGEVRGHADVVQNRGSDVR
jgi:mannose-1-phosphate guanylyltransferase